jgi:capsular polysaccharide biosynthesis protein
MLDTQSDAWCETTSVVEAAAPVESTADIVLCDSIHRADLGHEFRRRTVGEPVVNWRLRDVMLHARLALVFKDGQTVARTRLNVLPEEEDAARATLRECVRRYADRHAFVGFNRYCSNYFHLLTQIVPAVAGYRDDPAFRDGLLILGGRIPFVLDALALAGIGVPEILSVGPVRHAVAFNDLTFSSLLTGGEGVSRFRQAVFDTMAERAGVDPGMGHGLIYVSRRDATSRPMRNEAALTTLLARYGVEPVLLGELSLRSQIALFRRARLVIGPHGAGLANVVFSQPGAVLYELLPRHMMRSCMNVLAQQNGVHYWCDVHASEFRAGASPHHVPWSVDIPAVERRLTQILSTYRIG